MIRLAKFLVLFTAFVLSSAASADSHGHAASGGGYGAYCPAGYSGPINTFRGHSSFFGRFGPPPWAGGPTDTALFFHRRGTRLFDKNNFEGAERAFEASLRAQGGTLREHTFLYLAHIAIENGDMSKAESYAKEYAAVTGKEVVEALPAAKKTSSR